MYPFIHLYLLLIYLPVLHINFFVTLVSILFYYKATSIDVSQLFNSNLGLVWWSHDTAPALPASNYILSLVPIQSGFLWTWRGSCWGSKDDGQYSIRCSSECSILGPNWSIYCSPYDNGFYTWIGIAEGLSTWFSTILWYFIFQ